MSDYPYLDVENYFTKKYKQYTPRLREYLLSNEILAKTFKEYGDFKKYIEKVGKPWHVHVDSVNNNSVVIFSVPTEYYFYWVWDNFGGTSNAPAVGDADSQLWFTPFTGHLDYIGAIYLEQNNFGQDHMEWFWDVLFRLAPNQDIGITSSTRMVVHNDLYGILVHSRYIDEKE